MEEKTAQPPSLSEDKSSSTMRILIVEDEKTLGESLEKALEKEGYAVDHIAEGKKAKRRIEVSHEEYDLVILDLMLPEINGFEICKEIREKGVDIPVLILTAKYDIEDRVDALDAGADDYLVKPFSLAELTARIRALLRRPREKLPPKLKIQDLTLDPVTREVKWNDKEVDLTQKEFAILEHLMRHPNQVMSRSQILDHVWDYNFDSFSNIVDVHVKNLRKKLDNHGSIIETVRGVGYRIKDS